MALKVDRPSLLEPPASRYSRSVAHSFSTTESPTHLRHIVHQRRLVNIGIYSETVHELDLSQRILKLPSNLVAGVSLLYREEHMEVCGRNRKPAPTCVYKHVHNLNGVFVRKQTISFLAFKALIYSWTNKTFADGFMKAGTMIYSHNG